LLIRTRLRLRVLAEDEEKQMAKKLKGGKKLVKTTTLKKGAK